jgi:hypothetical protein
MRSLPAARPSPRPSASRGTGLSRVIDRRAGAMGIWEGPGFPGPFLFGRRHRWEQRSWMRSDGSVEATRARDMASSLDWFKMGDGIPTARGLRRFKLIEAWTDVVIAGGRRSFRSSGHTDAPRVTLRLYHGPAFCEQKRTTPEGSRKADRPCKKVDIPVEACGARITLSSRNRQLHQKMARRTLAREPGS